MRVGAGALCWSVKYERADGCLLWRLLVSYQRMRTRTGVKEMNKQEMLKQPMVVCTHCGWEIARSAVWIEPFCDDCAMDKMIEHNREQGL